MPFGHVISLVTIDSLEVPSMAAFPIFGFSTSTQNINLRNKQKHFQQLSNTKMTIFIIIFFLQLSFLYSFIFCYAIKLLKILQRENYKVINSSFWIICIKHIFLIALIIKTKIFRIKYASMKL